MLPSALAKPVLLFLLLAVIAFYFYGLGHLPLVGPDEPRYAQVAREMLMRGDLITPTLGGHAWFEKSVLLYWLMMLSFKIFGVTEQAARLGPAFAGVLTMFGVYWVGRRVEIAAGDDELKGFGLWSALVVGTSLGIVVFSRAASFDILITMTITWALMFFFVHELEHTRRSQTLFLAGFYAFLGLSLLAKGLVGFLPLGVVGLNYLLRRQMPRRYLLISLIWGLPLSAAVAAVWYAPVIARHGWLFVDQFIIQHHFARYLSNKYHHPQPVFFYLLIIVPLTLPWTPFFLNGIRMRRGLNSRRTDSINKLHSFSFAWLLLPILFFSFSGSKLPGYILPVVPAAALLAAERLTRFVSTGTIGRSSMRATGVLSLLFVGGGFLYVERFRVMSLRCALAIVIPHAVSGLFALLWTRMRATCAILIVCATVLSLITLLNCGASRVAERQSVKELIQMADARGYARLRVCNLHTIDQTTQFYASGRLIYGPDGEPAKFEALDEIVKAAQNSKEGVLVLVPVEYVTQLKGLDTAVIDVIGDNGKLAIVAVHLK